MIFDFYAMIKSGVPVSTVIIYGCILVIVLAFSLSIHEVMHGYVAYKLGDDTAKLQGRLTLNPLAHLDPFGTLMMLLVRIGWAKPVPVSYGRLTRLKNRNISIRLVSIAGVTSNFAVAFVSYFIFSLLTNIETYYSMGSSFSSFGIAIFDIVIFMFNRFYVYNLILMAFNLLPIPPLDGYHFIETFLPYQWKQKLVGYERNIGFVLLALFLIGNFTKYNPLGAIIGFIEIPFKFIIETPVNALANLLF